MAKAVTTSRSRVQRHRNKLRAAGLRPVQIWVPDTRAPGFAAEAERQCRALSKWERSSKGRAEMAFWDQFAAEVWEALDANDAA